MGDVSKKLMNQFATNLNKMLDQQPEAAAATHRPRHRDETDEEPEGANRGRRRSPRAGEKGSSNGETKADAAATDGGGKDVAATGGRRAQDQWTGRCAHRVVRRRRIGDPQACPPGHRWSCAAVDRHPSFHPTLTT